MASHGQPCQRVAVGKSAITRVTAECLRLSETDRKAVLRDVTCLLTLLLVNFSFSLPLVSCLRMMNLPSFLKQSLF